MNMNMNNSMNNKGMHNLNAAMNMGNNSNIGNFGNASGAGNLQPFGFPSANEKVKSVLNGGVLQGYASAREIRAKFPNANDCEIVVLEKHLV